MQSSKDIKKIQLELLLKCLLWTLPLCLLAIYFLINIRYEFILLICFILTCLIIFVPISIFNDKLNELIIKNHILPSLRKKFCESLSFDKDNNKNYKPDFQPLNSSFGTYFNSWKNITNVISGSLNGINFKIADANTRAGFSGFTFTSFYGQIIELTSNNLFNDEMLIKPIKIYNTNSNDSYLLNKEFIINKHVVYTKKDNIKCDKFLFLKNFIENYDKKKVYIRITENKMLIMIESNCSLLNKFNLINVREYNYKNIHMIFDLIKSLNN